MKKITIASPNGTPREIELSPAMEKHWSIPINHAQTILDQINGGMYERWFKGKTGMNVIDFGANVGLTALYFLPAVKKLVCVEPTPAHGQLLFEICDTYGRGKCLNFSSPLTEKQKPVIFMTGHSTENKITSAEGYGNGKIEIQGEPLSFFVNQFTEPVDFIKVDIEGYEIMALTIENIKEVEGKVRTFFVEVHPGFNGGMDENRNELVDRFTKCGYEVETLDHQTIVATWK
jgi:FkbM family methyltransferase